MARANRGSPEPPFSTRSAVYSPTAGPCLKPWPEPPPTTQTLSRPGWRSISEVAVRGVLVLADPGLHDRRVLQARGSARPRTPAPAGHRLGGDHALAVVGVEGGTVSVGRDLEAPALEVGHAVEVSGSKSIQVGMAGGAKRGSPGGTPKKKTCWRVGKMRPPSGLGHHLAEPRTAGEDERRSRSPTLRSPSGSRASRALAGGRQHVGRGVFRAARHCVGHHRLHGPASHEGSALGLPDRPASGRPPRSAGSACGARPRSSVSCRMPDLREGGEARLARPVRLPMAIQRTPVSWKSSGRPTFAKKRLPQAERAVGEARVDLVGSVAHAGSPATRPRRRHGRWRVRTCPGGGRRRRPGAGTTPSMPRSSPRPPPPRRSSSSSSPSLSPPGSTPRPRAPRG